MKGYKAFNKGWVCRDFKYEIGQVYELPNSEKPVICEKGFHFCKNPIDVFGYYPFSENTLIAEVEALGEIEQEGTKYVTNKIHIVKEFTHKQLQALILDGSYNTGNCNSGYRNSGNCNSGNYNSGYCNSGDYNSGYCNSGDYNSGDCNSGNYNSGDCNSGDYNSGYCNSGNYNSGDCNSGDCNSGNCNSGDYNSGNYNSGYRNSGNCNSGDYNSGIFNTTEPKMRAFNENTKITLTEFYNSIDYNFYALCERISENRLFAEDIERIKALPNFNAKVFKEITGIDIEEVNCI